MRSDSFLWPTSDHRCCCLAEWANNISRACEQTDLIRFALLCSVCCCCFCCFGDCCTAANNVWRSLAQIEFALERVNIDGLVWFGPANQTHATSATCSMRPTSTHPASAYARLLFKSGANASCRKSGASCIRAKARFTNKAKLSELPAAAAVVVAGLRLASQLIHIQAGKWPPNRLVQQTTTQIS